MRIASLFAGIVLACAGSGAMAAGTRLVSCGAQACLLVAGQREAASVPVAINGHEVMVSGARKWRVAVPVGQVREWSEPYARSIIVASGGVSRELSLPIGLLGHTTDLALLEVRAP
jgi:hypothetical protein